MNIVGHIHKLVAQVPRGRLTSYTAIADALGDRLAARTVAQVLCARPANIPWHRVVNSDGRLGAYEHMKAKMLKSEGHEISAGLVCNLKSVMFNDFETDAPLRKLRSEQMRLSSMVIIRDEFDRLQSVAGIDIAYSGIYALGAAVRFDYTTCRKVDEKTVRVKVDFPYIPTYLAYRELPVIQALEPTASILFIDGNGVLHPFGLGIASHVGVTLNVPTVGIAKRLLCGKLRQIPEKIGDYTEIYLAGERKGYALRTTKKNLIYISPGHKIGFETALDVVRRFLKPGNSLPEPQRAAHELATANLQKIYNL